MILTFHGGLYNHLSMKAEVTEKPDILQMRSSTKQPIEFLRVIGLVTFKVVMNFFFQI